jgi:hypothetical protein
LKDIDSIDLVMGDDSDANRIGLTLYETVNLHPPRCGKNLAISEAGDSAFREDHGGGHDGTSQRTASGFVDAGHYSKTFQEGKVKTKKRLRTVCFSPAGARHAGIIGYARGS